MSVHDIGEGKRDRLSGSFSCLLIRGQSMSPHQNDKTGSLIISYGQSVSCHSLEELDGCPSNSSIPDDPINKCQPDVMSYESFNQIQVHYNWLGIRGVRTKLK